MFGGETDAAGNQKGEHTDSAELIQARLELQAWKCKVEQADRDKSRLIMRKLEEEEEKNKALEKMKELHNKRQDEEKERKQKSQTLKVELARALQRKKDLVDRLKRSKDQLEQKRNEAQRLQHRFKIRADLPDKPVEFVKPKSSGEGDASSSEEPIRGQFRVSQQGALLLKPGQALITFEEEKVLSQVLQMDKCSVSFDDQTLDVKPKRFRTEPTVQFEVHLSVSRSHLDVAEVASAMPRERVEECLALSFSRPSRGGAEVKNVQYKPQKNTARVTFLKPGVAEWLALRGEYSVDLEFQTKVKVFPVFEFELQKFQTSCGVPKRTLLLDGIRDTGDEEEVQDQLEIHFQKPSNGGGEIENTKYCGPGRNVLAFLSPDH
ncbi:N-myc-interactor isoform X2 [Boleophthalmus pectinirostris]|uniref:N-myc-interactor isoform X2 n=1 Tax=Boleophthalmus pectinirostris TaxID=150288 RepID=UPI0024306988|nr:N-myc-interactor isoform X2 [Boleophthalmus pectinirostris]